MNHLLRNVLGGARSGLGAAALTVVNSPVNHWLFGYELRWDATLLAAALTFVLFAIGGGIYGLFLWGFTRNETHPPTRVRLLVGIAAGALTAGLAAMPYLREPRAGHNTHAGFLLIAVVLGTSVGAICGLFSRRLDAHRARSA